MMRIAIAYVLLMCILIYCTSTTRAVTTCSITVPVTDTTIDGSGNYSHIRPGDIVCLAAGSRPPLTIQNVRGQSGNMVTFINGGGVATIDAKQGRYAIEIRSSSFIRLSGTGVSDRCGSTVISSAQQCGIDLSNATKEIDIESTDGNLNNIEIDHITAHDSNPNGGFPTGISVKPRYLKNIAGIQIHHSYIHHTMFEGLYIGADPNKPESDNGTLSDVQIHHNLVESTGFDGINLKQATNVSVHHNIVRTTGLMNGKVQHVPEGGIQLAASVGEVFNNTIIDSDDTGINVGREQARSNTKFYNNLIVNTTNEGIQTRESDAMVYNNTVINSGAAELSVSGANAKVYNNIVVGIISGKNSGNNLIGSLSAMGFANPSTGDYRLTATSPAVDSGGTLPYPAFDIADTARPQGSRLDIGAYEYADHLPTVTPTKTPTPISSPSPCAQKSRGDSNCDGTIDIVDFEIFRKEYIQDITSHDADFDGNRMVELVDFEIWRRGCFDVGACR